MTEEEKEAIEHLKNGNKINIYTLLRTLKKEGIENFVITRKRYIDKILNLVNRQAEDFELLKEQEQYVINEYEETIEKKDKMIDLMLDRIEWLMKNNGILLDMEHKENFTKEDIKQYFERKAEV